MESVDETQDFSIASVIHQNDAFPVWAACGTQLDIRFARAPRMTEDSKPAALETAEQRLSRLRRMVQLAPHDPELRYLLARQLVESSLRDDAIDLIRSVIAMSPNHLEARKLLEHALRIQPARRP